VIGVVKEIHVLSPLLLDFALDLYVMREVHEELGG
jgi:hypothetical protein